MTLRPSTSGVNRATSESETQRCQLQNAVFPLQIELDIAKGKLRRSHHRPVLQSVRRLRSSTGENRLHRVRGK